MHLACKKDLWSTPPDVVIQLCRLSNNLYNSGAYENRQAFFDGGNKPSKLLSYPTLYHKLKSNENYGLMCAQAAQQTLKSVTEAMRSYKGLLKAFRYKLIPKEPRLPGYRTKGGLYQVSYPGQALKVEGGKIRIPLGKGGSEFFGQKFFFAPLPERLKDVQIRELRIIPYQGKFYLEYVTESLEVPASNSCKLYPENVLGVDPGINNLVTAVSNTGESFIIDGLELKSYNAFWNKQKAHYQGILDAQDPELKTSKKLRQLNINRANFMRDYVNKSARYIINWCLERGIDTVVWGANKQQKQRSNMGKRINQQFVQIPAAKLRGRVQQLCFIHGLRFVETEESYTSKASFVDLDFLPKFGEKPEGWKSSGKRLKRGLFRTSVRKLINADCNGAANIIRKVATTLGIDLTGVSIGCLTQPYRVRHLMGKFA
jgi:IS605 OrfB family transposase